MFARVVVLNLMDDLASSSHSRRRRDYTQINTHVGNYELANGTHELDAGRPHSPLLARSHSLPYDKSCELHLEVLSALPIANL